MNWWRRTSLHHQAVMDQDASGVLIAAGESVDEQIRFAATSDFNPSGRDSSQDGEFPATEFVRTYLHRFLPALTCVC